MSSARGDDERKCSCKRGLDFGYWYEPPPRGIDFVVFLLSSDLFQSGDNVCELQMEEGGNNIQPSCCSFLLF